MEWISIVLYCMVPRAGLEPASREAEDFETSVYTIPPSGQVTNITWKYIEIV